MKRSENPLLKEYLVTALLVVAFWVALLFSGKN